MVDVSTIGVALSILGQNFIWLLVGVSLGMILGIIPGMAGITALVILLPFTIGMDTYSAMILLAGSVGAVTFSGSITAILINTPGTASNAATLIEGFPLAQNGRAAEAIAASAVSSATGAVFGGFIFLLSIPLLLEIALLFSPSEVFWLVLTSIVVITLVVGNRPLMGLISGFFGFLFALMGLSPQLGEPRFSFGISSLATGLEIISVAMGLFAIAEIVRILSVGEKTITGDDPGERITGSRMAGIRATFRYKWMVLRSSIIGLVVGAIPGAGGTSAAFIAYGHFASIAPTVDEDGIRIGEGRIEGVIASEASNDAKDTGQLIPTLGLGIPGSAVMAVFLGGFLVHGIIPGPTLIVENLTLVIVIALAIMASNILTSVIGLVTTDLLTKILTVEVIKILPVILILAVGASFLTRNEIIDIWITLLFGGIGIVMIYLNISRIPMVVAFVLGTILETNWNLAISYARGDVVEAFFTGLFNWALIVILVVSVVLLIIPNRKLKEVIGMKIPQASE